MLLPCWSTTVWVTAQLVPAGITPSQPLRTMSTGEPGNTSMLTVVVMEPHVTSTVWAPEANGVNTEPVMLPLLAAKEMSSPATSLP